MELKQREEKLDVTFTLDYWDGDLTVYLGNSDVTSDVKDLLGKEAFRDLEQSFLPRERDRYQEWKDQQCEDAGL